jgi:hypothetical protein
VAAGNVSGLDAARIDSRKTLSLARDIFGDNVTAAHV